jgi:hypothetical protein
MGLWSFFSAYKKKNGSDKETDSGTTKQADRDDRGFLKAGTKKEFLEYIKANCELISESVRDVEEAKAEYQAVTSYLTDMQLIDMIPANEREDLEDSAQNIVRLTKDRVGFQQRNVSITDRQYRLFERYELQIPKELPSIRESESYQELIQKDMEHLENERQNLSGEEDEVIEKQAFLRGIAIAISVVILLLFGLFAILVTHSDADFTLPFLLTVLMGMGFALYAFIETRKNNYDLLQNQLKQKRLVALMNKVKIKYVHNRSFLDYIQDKYGIENYEQMKKLWDEYVLLKEEAKKYQSNTNKLEIYNQELVSELKRFGVADSEIWVYQANAIVDTKEMVEIRHRLNVRRQKLREQIDTGMKQKEESMILIENAIIVRPECREEAMNLLKKYKRED